MRTTDPETSRTSSERIDDLRTAENGQIVTQASPGHIITALHDALTAMAARAEAAEQEREFFRKLSEKAVSEKNSSDVAFWAIHKLVAQVNERAVTTEAKLAAVAVERDRLYAGLLRFINFCADQSIDFTVKGAFDLVRELELARKALNGE